MRRTYIPSHALVGGEELGLGGMAAAWIQRKRYVAILYGVTLDEIDRKHGGLAILSPTNVRSINEVDLYFAEVASRAKGKRDV